VVFGCHLNGQYDDLAIFGNGGLFGSTFLSLDNGHLNGQKRFSKNLNFIWPFSIDAVYF